jgi:hypothetical protein
MRGLFIYLFNFFLKKFHQYGLVLLDLGQLFGTENVYMNIIVKEIHHCK